MYSHSTNLNALCDSYASFEAKWEEEDGEEESLFSLLWNTVTIIIIALHNQNNNYNSIN